MSVLRFESVSKTYAGGRVALSDFSFALGEGEMAFATGHSGAGKSTLLKLAHLGERPSKGEVIFAGRNLARVRGNQIPAHRRQVGVVFQDHRLLAEYSVADNVGLPLVVLFFVAFFCASSFSWTFSGSPTGVALARPTI